MKSVDFSRFLNPVYVLVTGFLGGAITFLLFSPYFPLNCQGSINTFFCAPEFVVVFFLMTILWCLMAILLIPGWGVFIGLFKQHVAKSDNAYRMKEIVKLLVIAIILAASSTIVNLSGYQLNPEAQSRWSLDMPNGVSRIILINSVSLFLVFLPYLLGMVLVNSVVRDLRLSIRTTHQFPKDQAFDFINDLLTYRKLLQVFLIVSGVLLSMVPLIIVALRSVLIRIDSGFGNIYPVTNVTFQGLMFTLLLLLIYSPAYLELSVTGQQVRDILCPLKSSDDLKNTLEKRKALDDLLQTEVSFTSNLKSGILTLGPLIASLLAFLGIKP